MVILAGGASRHSSFSSIGFHNHKDIDVEDRISVRNGETINLDAIGAQGSLPTCCDCATTKARQRNVLQVSHHVPTKDIYDHLFPGVSTIRRNDDVVLTNPVWLMKVDKATGMNFSSCLPF